MSQGSRFCPIVSEFTNITKGIQRGDLGQIAVNGGILGYYAGSVTALPKSAASGNFGSLGKKILAT